MNFRNFRLKKADFFERILFFIKIKLTFTFENNNRNDYQKHMKRKFSAEERRSLLLNQLKTEGKIYVTDLMKQFDVSEVSIRKDLAVLEERKLLLRVKGGAVDMHQSGDYDDMTISQKQHLHSHEKQLLGKFAAGMIRNGETVILDSGTTTMEIAKNLENFNELTVITNALDIAITLNHYDRFSVIALGGKMRSVSYSTVGMLAESALKNFYCDKLFLGVDSVSIKDGISTPNLEEASLNQAMINSAKEVIAIFDSSKLGRRSFVHIASLDKIDTIITDSGISPDFKDYVEASGIKLHIVEV